MTKNPYKIHQTVKTTSMTRPENQSMGILDDFAVRKNVATKEGSIEKYPINTNDITNKAYVDRMQIVVLDPFDNVDQTYTGTNVTHLDYKLGTTVSYTVDLTYDLNDNVDSATKIKDGVTTVTNIYYTYVGTSSVVSNIRLERL